MEFDRFMHPLFHFLAGRSGRHTPRKIRGGCRVVAVGLRDGEGGLPLAGGAGEGLRGVLCEAGAGVE